MRLNKWLVLAGVASSRRRADELIAAGRITRNDRIAQIGEQVLIDDNITLDDKQLRISTHTPHLIAFHKPRGVISSHVRQDKRSKIIFDYLPLGWQHDIIIGRLDRDSEGLVLLTNNGNLAHQLMHPSFGEHREYLVFTNQPVSDQQLNQLTSGVELEDGISQAISAKREASCQIRIILGQGRNRQIRRSLTALGQTVNRLVRIRHGVYQLDNLQPGKWQELTIREQL